MRPFTSSSLCTLQMSTAMHIDTHALPAMRSRFAELRSRCIDPETFTLADFELWLTLDGHTHEGGDVLDLRPHGEALVQVPAELMEAFFDVCRCHPTPLKALYLPGNLPPTTPWLAACPDGVLIVQEAELQV